MLLDTSGLFCALNARLPEHAEAAGLLSVGWDMLTHSYVLAELQPLAHSRGYPRDPTLDFLDAIHADTRIEIVWVNEMLHLTAMTYLRHRPDKEYSLCDAVSFILMRQRKLSEALTTDHHFTQEGFHKLLG